MPVFHRRCQSCDSDRFGAPRADTKVILSVNPREQGANVPMLRAISSSRNSNPLKNSSTRRDGNKSAAMGLMAVMVMTLFYQAPEVTAQPVKPGQYKLLQRNNFVGRRLFQWGDSGGGAAWNPPPPPPIGGFAFHHFLLLLPFID